MTLILWCSGAGGAAFEEECLEEAVEPPLAREWQPDDVIQTLDGILTRNLWARVIHFDSFVGNVLAFVGLLLWDVS